MSERVRRAFLGALNLAIVALLPGTDHWIGPVAAEELARGAAYSSLYNFTPATRQALLVPPTVDPEKFAKDQKLAGHEIVRVPGDFSSYGGWALISFEGSEEDAQKLCKDNPALKLCELDRCREFLPASESGFVPGLGAWRAEKEFTVAMAEGSKPSGGGPTTGTTGASEAAINVAGSNAVANTREQPPTPEQFVKGESVGYGPEAAKGPDLKTLPAGATSTLAMSLHQEVEVGSGWDQIVVQPRLGPPIVAKANEDVSGGTITRPPGGGTPTPPTRPRPPNKPPMPPETPGKPPDLSPPGGPPPSRPPEEEQEEILACKLFGKQESLKIAFPDVKEFIEPVPDKPGQEAINHPAMGGYQTWLHDLSFYHYARDLFVESTGIDFFASRFYRSNIRTLEGGLFGYNWDFGYYKRLVPQGGALDVKTYLRVESLFLPGPVHFMPGNGRVEKMQPSGLTRLQTVQNFGSIFSAWVTYYKPPDNLFVELERYVLLPEQPSPFAKHPNYEGDMFYVLRFKNGYREVYSCRGILLYMMDRNDNVMEFDYNVKGSVFHPFTFNPMIEKIIDSLGRGYELEWREIGGNGDVRTNYKNQVIKGSFPKLRLWKLKDFDGRLVEYDYARDGPVLDVVWERSEGDFPTKHTYEELDGRYYLKALTLPREAKQQGSAYLTNHWKSEGKIKRIQAQTIGEMRSRSSGAGANGGHWEVNWIGKPEPGSPVEIKGPNEGVVTYRLDRPGVAYVVAQIDAQLDGGQMATTQFRHNAFDQVTLIEKPEGNLVEYEYEKKNSPIFIPESPIQDVQGTANYLNNLARGNLKKKILRAGRRNNPLPYSDITINYEYEPLYNRLSRIDGPSPATITVQKYVYNVPGAEGNPILRRNPRRTTAEGKVLGPIDTAFAYASNGLLASVTDPMGHATSFGYDRGYLVSVRNDEDQADFSRDSRGNMTSHTDARGLRTEYTVDKRDLVRKKVEDPGGVKNETTYRYDDNRNLIEEVVKVQDIFPDLDALKKVERQSYDLTKTYAYNLANLRVLETHLASGPAAGTLTRERRSAYDASGRLISVAQPEGLTVEYAYDRLGNIVEKKVGGRLKETFQYDKNGNVIAKQRGTAGGRVTYLPDPFDRDYQMILPLGTTITTALNPDGTTRFVKVRGKNHERKEVDLLHTEYEYDELQLERVTKEHLLDSRGMENVVRITRFVRDIEGKVVRVEEAGDKHTTFEYAGHRKASETDALGNKVLYTYEEGGKPDSLTEVEAELTYTVTELGILRPTQQTKSYGSKLVYDKLGRVMRSVDAGRKPIWFAYNSEGNMRARYEEEGGRLDVYDVDGFGRAISERQLVNLAPQGKAITITRSYDLLDRPIDLAVSRGNRVVSRTTRTYRPDGLVASLNADKLLRTFEDYDDRGNLIKESRAGGLSIGYRYDEEDHNTLITVDYPDHAVGRSARETYRYDGLGRLTEAALYGGFVTSKMGYDSLGNLDFEEQIIGGREVGGRIQGGYGLMMDYGMNAQGHRATLESPTVGDMPGVSVLYRRDVLGRVVSIEPRPAHPLQPTPFTDMVTYDYSGSFRTARRTIGEVQHTAYGYDEAQRPIQALMWHVPKRTQHGLTETQLEQTGKTSTAGLSFNFPGDSAREETKTFAYTPWGSLEETKTQSNWSDEPTKTNASGTGRMRYRYQDDRLEAISSFESSRLTRTRETSEQIVRALIPPLALAGDALTKDKDKAVTLGANGEVVRLVYEQDRLKQTEFWYPGQSTVDRLAEKARLAPAGTLDSLADWAGLTSQEDIAERLGENDVRAALQTVGYMKKYTTTFTYDATDNLVQDNRYRYEYDRRNLISRATDTYTFGARTERTATYYYDYANRLVYIEYGPSAARAEFEGVFPNRRILYDGSLPFLEMTTDRDGKPKQVEVAYLTHPAGADVGPILVRTHYDQRGVKERPPMVFYPFFDPNGSLMHVYDRDGKTYGKVGLTLDSAVRSEARRRHVVLPRFGDDLKPEDLVALRPEHPRREIPLMSITTWWDPFTETAIDLRTGRFLFDPLRNLQLKLKTAQEAQADYLHEMIAAGQKRGLLMMTVLGAPAFIGIGLAEGGAMFLRILARDMVIDVAADIYLRTALGQKYGWGDLLETAAFSPLISAPFSAVEVVMRAEPAALGKLRQAAREAADAHPQAASQSVSPTPDPVVRPPAAAGPNQVGLERLLKALDDAGDFFKSADGMTPERARSIWSSTGKSEELMDRVLHILKVVGDGGYAPARRAYEDLQNGIRKIVWAPEIKAAGLHWDTTIDGVNINNILLINPYRGGTVKANSIFDIATTILHEYTHSYGYNEIRAFFEELVFVWRMTRYHKTALGIPGTDRSMNALAQIAGELRGEQLTGGAHKWLHEYVTGLSYTFSGMYKGNVDNYIANMSSLYGGHKQSIRAKWNPSPEPWMVDAIFGSIHGP